jgi:hypothetical protein
MIVLGASATLYIPIQFSLSALLSKFTTQLEKSWIDSLNLIRNNFNKIHRRFAMRVKLGQGKRTCFCACPEGKSVNLIGARMSLGCGREVGNKHFMRSTNFRMTYNFQNRYDKRTFIHLCIKYWTMFVRTHMKNTEQSTMVTLANKLNRKNAKCLFTLSKGCYDEQKCFMSS